MDLLNAFQGHIKKEQLFRQTDKLLLAISGGVDSVVLCELCKQSGYDFSIAHCNFQLRGAESERDEQFVKGLGTKYGVEVRVKNFETQKYAAENKCSIQVAARELRYRWFEELLRTQSFVIGHWVLTAHHANDNIETLLMNFFKGTGIGGLRAILPKQGKIVRPLLFATKEEIVSFAGEQKLSFAEDSSNASDKYTRNYFRNKLIPGIKEVFPQVEENLTNNIQRFRETEQLYRQAIDLHKSRLLEQKGTEIHIPVLKLQNAKPLDTIVYEIISDFGFTAHQTAECIALFQSESGKYIQSSTHRIIKNRNWLIIAPIASESAANILVEEGTVSFTAGELSVKKLSATPNFKPQISNQVAELDASAIRFPLLLRKWKTGDYFYPLGMQKKKKVSRFLIDQKLSLTQKENVWVLEMNKKILWVIGLRIDDRFRITASTKEILQVKFSATK